MKRRRPARLLSLLLCAVMVLGLLPAITPHVHAGEWDSMSDFYADGGWDNISGALGQCDNCGMYYDEDDGCGDCNRHVACLDEDWEGAWYHYLECLTGMWCADCDERFDDYCDDCMYASGASTDIYHFGCGNEEAYNYHLGICLNMFFCHECYIWVESADVCFDCLFSNPSDLYHDGCTSDEGERYHLINCEDYILCENCDEAIDKSDYCEDCLDEGYHNHGDGDCTDGGDGAEYHFIQCLGWEYCFDCDDYYEDSIVYCDDCGLCDHQWEECEACGEPCSCVCLETWCDECDVCENVYETWACETCDASTHDEWHDCENDRCSDCGMCEDGHDNYYGAQQCESSSCPVGNEGGCPSLCDCWETGFAAGGGDVDKSKEEIAALPAHTVINITVTGTESGEADKKLAGVRAWYKAPGETTWAYLGISDEDGLISKNISAVNPATTGWQVRLGDGKSSLIATMGAQWGGVGSTIAKNISFSKTDDKNYAAAANFTLPKYQDISGDVKGILEVGIQMPGKNKLITKAQMDDWTKLGYFTVNPGYGYWSAYYGVFLVPKANGVPLNVAEFRWTNMSNLGEDIGYGAYFENLPQGEYMLLVVLPGCRPYLEESFTFVLPTGSNSNWTMVEMKKEAASPAAGTAYVEFTAGYDLESGKNDIPLSDGTSIKLLYSINDQGKKMWSVNEYNTNKFAIVTGEALLYPYFNVDAQWHLVIGENLDEGETGTATVPTIYSDGSGDPEQRPIIEFRIDDQPLPKNKKVTFNVYADIPYRNAYINITAPGTLGAYEGLSANGLPNIHRGPEQYSYKGSGKAEALQLSNFNAGWYERISYPDNVGYYINAYCDGYAPIENVELSLDGSVTVVNFETGVCPDGIHTNENIGSFKSCKTMTASTYYKCKYCGYRHTLTIKDSSIKHTWKDGIILTPSTETSDGLRQVICTICGITDEQKIAAHECNDSGGENGNATHCWLICSICGGEVEKGEHSPSGGPVASMHNTGGYIPYKCRCGYDLRINVGHTNCAATEWTVGATDHYHLNKCGLIADKEPHTFDDGMTVTYDGKTDTFVHTCTVCDGTVSVLVSKADTPLAALSLTMPAPVRGAAAAKLSDIKGETGYTVAALSLSPDHGSYQASTEYAATITLEADSGYVFVTPKVKLNGAEATLISSSYEQLVFGYTFPATGKAPDTSPPDTSSPSGGGTSVPAKTDTEKAIESIEKAKDGDTVKIDLGTKTEVEKEILEAIAGKDITVEITVGDVVWIIDGMDVPLAGLTGLDLGVSVGTSTIPVDIINAITGEKDTIQLTLKHEGPFGFPLVLQAPLGKEHAGLYANLYFYNKTTGEMEFKTVAVIGSDGKAKLTFTRASEYAIVIDNESHGKSLPFTDVKESDWFYNDVAYVYEAGLMTGTAETLFSPGTETSRAMIVTILYRLEGEPAVTEKAGFADVPTDTWYTNAVAWAQANGIVKGYSAEKFGPNDPITREQMAVILANYAKLKGYDVSASADLSTFSDTGSVSSWAIDAITWANAEALINGKGGGILDPRGNATRAEVAAILTRFCENIVK